MDILDNDDIPVGRVLSRREVLALMGTEGAALLAAACTDAVGPVATSTPTAATRGAPAGTATRAATASATAPAVVAVPSCVVVPALTEGPFFVDEKLNRSDIRIEPAIGAISAGAPLALTFNVAKIAGGCTSLAGAMVDVWQCNAVGMYSDVAGQGNNSAGQKFLRGHQITDAKGIAKFTTIVPGWYQGRAVHIHFKIRSGNSEFVSQLFFDDALIDQIHGKAPYAAKGQRTVKNANDSIFRDSKGVLTLKLAPSGDGYASTFDIGIQAA